MPKARDLTGERFYKWMVIKKSPTKEFTDSYLCRCDCGKEVIVRGNNLKKGTSRGCK